MADIQSTALSTLFPVAPEDPTDRAADSLSPDDLRVFQQLVKDNCGEQLDDGAVWTRATQLIDLLRMFMRPLQEDPELTVEKGSSVVSLARFRNVALR